MSRSGVQGAPEAEVDSFNIYYSCCAVFHLDTNHCQPGDGLYEICSSISVQTTAKAAPCHCLDGLHRWKAKRCRALAQDRKASIVPCEWKEPRKDVRIDEGQGWFDYEGIQDGTARFWSRRVYMSVMIPRSIVSRRNTITSNVLRPGAEITRSLLSVNGLDNRL
nr:hypothetical protein CFP56_52839 [Quercus suber]